MPRRDGTGPLGRGMGTGRGLGYCYANEPLYQRNFGFRRFLNNNRVILDQEQPSYGVTDKELLAEQKTFLESQLNYINKQLNEL